MSVLHVVGIVVGVGIAWFLVAWAIGTLEKGHEQGGGDAEDHNGD